MHVRACVCVCARVMLEQAPEPQCVLSEAVQLPVRGVWFPVRGWHTRPAPPPPPLYVLRWEGTASQGVLSPKFCSP
jgi:hypothetical protein